MKYSNVIFFILLFSLGGPLYADLFYFPHEYNALYNEKVALQFELKQLKTQFRNDQTLQSRKFRKLDAKIKVLEARLKLSEKNRKSERALNRRQISALKRRINILKTKSSKRERALIAQTQKEESRLRKEIERIRREREKENRACLKKIADIENRFQKKRVFLENRITTLNDELSRLKNLSKHQKLELNRLADQARAMELKLKKEIEQGQIRVKIFHNRLVINIDDKISFDSGSAKLKKAIIPAIKIITNIVNKYPENRIIVEGHTDNIPIRTRRFRDNWQLSTARALSVLREILKNKKSDPRKFSAAGYGSFQPIMPNNSAENRSLNRRVDIVVIPGK